MALRSSLAEARGRNAKHEVAAALSVLLELDESATPAEREQWTRERDELVDLLGLVQARPTGVPA